MTTITGHTNGEAPVNARLPWVTAERMRVFATAACDADDRGHP
jgi:hypothetical protein